MQSKCVGHPTQRKSPSKMLHRKTEKHSRRKPCGRMYLIARILTVILMMLNMMMQFSISVPQCPLLHPNIGYARRVAHVARVSIRKRTLAWRRAHPEMAMGSLEIDVRVEFLFSRFPSGPVWFTCYLLVFSLFSYVFLASFMILLAVSGCVHVR